MAIPKKNPAVVAAAIAAAAKAAQVAKAAKAAKAVKAAKVVKPAKAVKSVPKPAKVPVAKSLKETGLAKLAKAGRTTSEGDIGYAVRHGKITQQEAAAIDPKKFPLPVKPKTIATFDLKTGKVTKGK
jgi:hypothetical protein